MNARICPSCGVGLSNQFVCRTCGVILPVERYRAALRFSGSAVVTKLSRQALTAQGLLWIAALTPMLLVPPAAILFIGLFGRNSLTEKDAVVRLPMMIFAGLNIIVSIAIWRELGPSLFDFLSKGVFQPLRPTSKSITI